MKNSLMRVALLILAVLLVILPLSGCDTEKDTEQGKKTEYSITVKSEAGLALQGVRIKVYNEDLTNLFWAGTTDKEGRVSFNGFDNESYIYKIEEVPAGYIVADSYTLDIASENTIATLEIALLPAEEIHKRTFVLGSVMFDFEITDTDGVKQRLSTLLETERAVVLNFWFEGCGPCRMEFPYMQEAYAEYSDKLEIIAINPVDGTDSSVGAYKSELGLGFPMAAGSMDWNSAFKLTGFPTTVVIDRYGVITMVHMGAITDKETFVKMFEHFTSDDYQQSTVKSINRLS
ncbi:MAG: redoxin domain-containing protein [Clostridia bacterium]|nr:redoxin domain-containing protein [Clostridia bacterium]